MKDARRYRSLGSVVWDCRFDPARMVATAGSHRSSKMIANALNFYERKPRVSRLKRAAEKSK